jgi:hypothetical protein
VPLPLYAPKVAAYLRVRQRVCSKHRFDLDSTPRLAMLRYPRLAHRLAGAVER